MLHRVHIDLWVIEIGRSRVDKLWTGRAEKLFEEGESIRSTTLQSIELLAVLLSQSSVDGVIKPCWLKRNTNRNERVHLIVENASSKKRVTSMLRRAGANLDQVAFHCWPTDRGWTRDSGPIFVRTSEGRVALTDWRFNGWAKYSDWHLDDKLPGRVAKLLGVPSWQPLV